MRFRFVIIIFTILLLLLPIYQALGQGQSTVQYQIMINSDSSATWTITLVTDINTTVDSFNGFMQRINTLIATAENVTGRTMEIGPTSPQLETTIGTQDKISTYTFTWDNFSVIQNNQINCGDVFKTPDFFTQLLYGDGDLQVTFPATCAIKSVAPSPDQQIGKQTLHWYRTQDFISGNPSIILTILSPNISSSPSYSSGSSLPLIPIITAVVISAVAVSMFSFYFVRRSQHKKAEDSNTETAINNAFESDEDKVLKLLRSSGGSLNQSDIAERCKFSRAKTSQLLSELERKSIIKRYKKGRDKIVTLNESEPKVKK